VVFGRVFEQLHTRIKYVFKSRVRDINIISFNQASTVAHIIDVCGPGLISEPSNIVEF
jgi:hypothetical protein